MLNKKTVAVVLAVLLAAALTFALRSCSADDAAPRTEPAPTATTKPPPQSSTAYIVDRIKPRLDTLSGLDTKLDCPKTILLVAKNTMECEVFGTPDGSGDPVAVVTVTMKDKTGYFTWKSERVEPEKD